MARNGIEIDLKNITIGQYADYFDTGIWSLANGHLVGPQDLTIAQLKDFLLASGGGVYLRRDGRFGWVQLKCEAAEGEQL